METLYDFRFVHIHKLSKNHKLKDKCCVCQNVDVNKNAYHCIEKGCENFYFCFECAKHADKEEILKLHPQHLLKPKKRKKK